MSKEITEYKGNSPVENIKKLLGSGVSIKDLKEFLDLQKEWEESEAVKAYNLDMAEFKKNVPDLLKTKHVRYESKKTGEVTEYYHADLGEIVATLLPALAEYGFNHSWNYEQDSNGITVTCVITHKQGHSKSNPLCAPPDSSGGKNTIQAISSTTTYLERYTFLGSLGLAAKGMDDDGRGAEPEEPEQPKELTPESQNWQFAKNAWLRDGNLKKVLSISNVSEENQALIIYQCAREIYEQNGDFKAIDGYEGLTDEIMSRIIEEEK